MIQIGKCHLRRLLAQKNMTQAELSRRTGISTPQLNRYINNVHIMPLPVAYTIARILDCSVDDLYDVH